MKFPLSIRTKLGLAFLLVMAVTQIVGSGLTLNIIADFVDQEAKRELLNVSQSIQLILELQQEEARAEAKVVALRADVQQSILEADRHTLLKLTKRLMAELELDYIAVTDEDGVVLARGHAPGQFGDDISNLTILRWPLHGLNIATITGMPTLPLMAAGGAPVFEQQPPYRLIGGVITGYSIDDRSVAELRDIVGDEVSIIVANERLYSSLPGASLDEQAVYSALEAEERSLSLIDVADQSYRAVHTPLFGLDDDAPIGLLEVAQSEAATTMIWFQTARVVGSGAILVALAALAAALWLGSRITRPLVQLTKAAHTYGQGNLNQRVDIDSGDEIEELGSAFNQMAANLQIAKAELYTREAEIRNLNLELEQRVAERTAQLKAANEELEAFSYSVSHDLRTPLRHIHGFIELLQREEAKDGLTPTSARYFKIIAESVTKMKALIDDLLSLSRKGSEPMRTQPVELNQLIAEVQQELTDAVVDRHIMWQVSSLPTVIGDRNLLKLVWINLLSNAIKYTGPRDEAHIEIGVTENGTDTPLENEGVTLFVRDNGVGFDPQYTHKLFGAFQRLHREQEFEGHGVGLATVRRIIHRHGGRVWAEGEIDQGASFYLRLKEGGQD